MSKFVFVNHFINLLVHLCCWVNNSWTNYRLKNGNKSLLERILLENVFLLVKNWSNYYILWHITKRCFWFSSAHIVSKSNKWTYVILCHEKCVTITSMGLIETARVSQAKVKSIIRLSPMQRLPLFLAYVQCMKDYLTVIMIIIMERYVS